MKYMVIKNVSISSPMCKKKYKKDDIFTHEEFSVNDIKRLLSLKYIKCLNEFKHLNEEYVDLNTLDSSCDNEGKETATVQANSNPFNLEYDKYLTPKQVEELDKAQLLEYCEHIGITGFKQNITQKNLRELINKFIEEENNNDNVDVYQ